MSEATVLRIEASSRRTPEKHGFVMEKTPQGARFLRSVDSRNELFMRAGGKCAICFVPLDGSWHADHKVPYSMEGPTTIENMQATCPQCNLRKGARTMIDYSKLRSHQRRLAEIADDIIAGKINKKIISVGVTPGGGKSLGAVMFGQKLCDAEVTTKVVWVMPKVILRDQAEKDANHSYRKYGIYLRLGARASAVMPLFHKTEAGYITTYQSIFSRLDVHMAEMERVKREGHKVLLILDEPHHMFERNNRDSLSNEDLTDSDDQEMTIETWSDKVAPMVESATAVLFMTGSMTRHDRQKIAFLEYEKREDGLEYPVFDVKYTRAEAIREKAVRKIELRSVGGTASYKKEKSGDVRHYEVDIDKIDDYTKTDALRTIFAPGEWRDRLIDQAFQDWVAYRESPNGFLSGLLVVCHSQNAAYQAQAYIQQKYKVLVDIATNDTPESHKTLKYFREGKTGADILVNVSMACEGFDAPRLTHLIYLTDIRSNVYQEQTWARAQRVYHGKNNSGEDVQFEHQTAIIYAPCDPELMTIWDEIRKEQEQGLCALPPPPPPTPPPPPPPPPVYVRVIPIKSQFGDAKYSDLVADGTDEENELMKIIGKTSTLEQVRSVLDAQRKMGIIFVKGDVRSTDSIDRRLAACGVTDDMTPSEQIRHVKTETNNHVKFLVGRYYKKDDLDAFSKLNGILKSKFGRGEEVTTLDAALDRWEYATTTLTERAKNKL